MPVHFECDEPSVSHDKQAGKEEGPAVALEMLLEHVIFMHEEGALAVYTL